METPSTSTSWPTTSESITYSIHDPPGYIEPSSQDMLLTYITAEKLLSVAEVLGVGYLSPAATFPGSFPVDGEIYRPNNRLMINLVCRRRRKNTHAINVIFLIDTGSPITDISSTFLAKNIIGSDSTIFTVQTTKKALFLGLFKVERKQHW